VAKGQKGQDLLPIERVLKTFAHEAPDVVAVHHIGFSSRAASYVLGHEAYVGGGIQQWREAVSCWEGEVAHEKFIERTRRDAIELAEATQQDIVRYEYWRMNAKPCKLIDKFTLMFGEPEGKWEIRRLDPETELFQVVAPNPKREENFEALEGELLEQEESIRDLPTEADFEEVKAIFEQLGNNYAIRVGGGSIGIPLGSRIWLQAVVARPDIVSRLFDMQAKIAMRDMGMLSKIGAKLIFGGGDIASGQGPFYSPKSFRELMLPRLRSIAESCHDHGMYYLFGSDGNLWPIADDLFGKSGVDGYYEIDGRAGMDLADLRRRYPNLTCIGNISSHTLHRGSVEDVISETKSCIEKAKINNGIVVGVSNQITSATPRENVCAMLETISRFKRARGTSA